MYFTKKEFPLTIGDYQKLHNIYIMVCLKLNLPAENASIEEIENKLDNLIFQGQQKSIYINNKGADSNEYRHSE